MNDDPSTQVPSLHQFVQAQWRALAVARRLERDAIERAQRVYEGAVAESASVCQAARKGANREFELALQRASHARDKRHADANRQKGEGDRSDQGVVTALEAERARALSALDVASAAKAALDAEVDAELSVAVTAVDEEIAADLEAADAALATQLQALEEDVARRRQSSEQEARAACAQAQARYACAVALQREVDDDRERARRLELERQLGPVQAEQAAALEALRTQRRRPFGMSESEFRKTADATIAWYEQRYREVNLACEAERRADRQRSAELERGWRAKQGIEEEDAARSNAAQIVGLGRWRDAERARLAVVHDAARAGIEARREPERVAVVRRAIAARQRDLSAVEDGVAARARAIEDAEHRLAAARSHAASGERRRAAELAARLAEVDAGYEAACAEAASTRDQALRDADTRREAVTRAAATERDRYRATLLSEAREARQQALTAMVEARAAARWCFADFSDPAWEGWTTPDSSRMPDAVRVGEASVSVGGETVPLEVLAPTDRALVLLHHGAHARPEVCELAQAIALRLLASVREGALDLVVLDPHMGDNGGFHGLATSGLQVLTHVQQGERVVSELQALRARRVDGPNQTFLNKRTDSLAAYNARSPKPEPHTLVMVYDWPHDYPEAAVKHLETLLRLGPRCGLMFVVAADRGALSQGGRDARGSRRFWEGRDAVEVQVKEPPDLGWAQLPEGAEGPSWHPLPEERREELVRRIAAEWALARSRARSPALSRVLEDAGWHEEKAWRGELLADERIRAPIGRNGAGAVHWLQISQQTATDTEFIHGAFVGATGSGKSSFLHTLIAALTLRYAPDELELYLIDAKTSGPEFRVYARGGGLPHARVISEADLEFAAEVLHHLANVEMGRRLDDFKEIESHRRSLGRERAREAWIPRILVLVDEYGNLLKGEADERSEKLREKLLGALAKIADQGRAAGIHLLLGGHEFTTRSADPRMQGVADAVSGRLALARTQKIVERFFFGNLEPKGNVAERTSRLKVGEALQKVSNEITEVVIADYRDGAANSDEAIAGWVDRVVAIGRRLGFERPARYPTVTYRRESAAYNATSSARYHFHVSQESLQIALGEAVGLDIACVVTLERTAARSVLIVGRNARAVAAVVEATCAGAALPGVRVVAVDGEGSLELRDLAGAGTTLLCAPSLDRFLSASASTATRGTLRELHRCVTEGPPHGVHLIAGLTNVHDLLEHELDWMRHFEFRVALPMPPKDVRSVTGVTTEIPGHLAMLIEATRPSGTRMFKPWSAARPAEAGNE